MNETTRKIKIKVTPKKTADGRSFNTYKTFSKNGRAVEVKFRKECKNIPEKDCFVICNEDDMNLNVSGEFPVMWIRSIVDTEDLETASAEANRKRLADFFD